MTLEPGNIAQNDKKRFFSSNGEEIVVAIDAAIAIPGMFLAHRRREETLASTSKTEPQVVDKLEILLQHFARAEI